MDTQEEKIGYLLARVEDMNSTLTLLVHRHDELEKTVEGKFKTAETVFKTLKFMGLVSMAILTLRFGDIVKLYHYIFH